MKAVTDLEVDSNGNLILRVSPADAVRAVGEFDLLHEVVGIGPESTLRKLVQSLQLRDASGVDPNDKGWVK